VAGSSSTRERVIVAGAAGIADTVSEVEAAGGRVLHRLGDRAVIVSVPEGVDVPGEEVPPATSFGVSGGPLGAPPALAEARLSDAERLSLRAFALRHSDEFAGAKAQRPLDGAGWDTPEATSIEPPGQALVTPVKLLPPMGGTSAGGAPPGAPASPSSLEALTAGLAPANAAQGSTSTQMTGSVAVGVIIVNGLQGFGNLLDGQHPIWLGDFTGAGHTQLMFYYAGDGNWWLGDMAGGQIQWTLRGNTYGDELRFNDTEREKLIAEVQDGLANLAGFEPTANLSWHYDIRVANVFVAPDPSRTGYEPQESLWRDPAMQAIGYGTGMSEVSRYITDLRSSLGTNWTYCVFFTKYPVEHFAYADIGGPRVVIQYANDGWGPDNIDRVFAHESGHIFQAPDEYSSSGCDCGGSWGIHDEPNGNCEVCNPNSVDCLMKANTYALCDHTRRAFGW